MSEESKPTDLLSGDDGGEEAVAMPPSTADPTKYSIDDEDYNKLEENYSDDDDDDDDLDEDDQAGRNISALASRTNHLINSYRDYIAEMSNDPVVGGDADAAAAVIAVMEGGKTAEVDDLILEEEGEEESGTRALVGQFQDARKGATLYSDFSYRDDPPHENNNINLRAHHFDDDPSFANYDGDLGPSRNGRGRYVYAMVRSRTFRRCAVGVLAVGAIIGMTVGIVKSQQRKKNLPDWEGMLTEEQQGGVVSMGGDGPTNVQPILPQAPTQQQNQVISEEMMKEYQESGIRYHPVWFDREDGWNGQTYDAAVEFCATQDRESVICPYDAICPLGVDLMPLGGAQKGADPTGSTWAPLGDGVNTWVQVGLRDSWCEQLVAPEWGVTGGASEGFTRHVACCKVPTAADDAFPPSSGSNQIAQEIGDQMTIEKYDGEWFDRTSGWMGNDYALAVSFCAQQGFMVVCPYEAYCPEGVAGVPMGGVKVGFTGERDQWAPIGDKKNEWVQVGPDNSCVKRTDMTESSPQWEFTLEGSQMITQHIMCCPVDGVQAGNSNTMTQEDATVATVPPPAPSTNSIQDGQMTMVNESGVWFDRTTGWVDADYYMAMSFCAQRGLMVVCPYEAYCPDGADGVPMGGVKVGMGGEREQWAPVGNKRNEWVQVGPDNSCVKRTDMTEASPQWEFTAEGSHMVTQHIMCCPVDGAGAGVTVPPPAPTPASVPAVEVTAEAKKAQFDWAAEAYDPEWFDRSSGWTGTNYVEAIDFCKQQQGKMICPYEAYCPMTKALGSEPFGGSKSEYAWAPIDDSENWWVQVSGTDTCQLYNEMNGGPPSWGMGGKNELETRYVLCCKEPDAGMNDADYYHSSMADETDTQTEVVVIAKDECKDHPTAIITPKGQTCETFISHVGRVNLHNARCGHETALKDENGVTLLIKDVCRLSCGACGDVWPLSPPVATPVAAQPQPAQTVAAVEENSAMLNAEANFRMTMYDRDNGWEGSSYSQALMFCGSKGATLCPYESYCPQGPGSSVMGGAVAGSQWAPFINVANGWVQIGADATCMPYNSLNSFPPEWGLTGLNKAETSHIMCCEPDDNWVPADQVAKVTLSSAPSEIDKMAMDMFKPIWFERKHGWNGGSHADAEKFCNNIGDMELCPSMALCPDGNKLFNDKQPFPGEQWVPLNDGDWTSVGAGVSTCQQYHVLNNKPSSDVDGMPEDVKQHIMCCAKSRESAGEQNLEEVLKGSMEPTWYSTFDGWNGGSHSDAVNFCQQEDKKLCPYVGYCPYGEGSQAFPGHPVDFNTESEQWSPWVEGTGKGWVMVSQKYQNSATTCMTYKDLEGGIPPWENSGDFAEAKKYVLCCNTRNPPAQPINPLPAPVPSPPVTPQVQYTPQVQAVKWYPQASDGQRKCVQGNDYDSSFVTEGWVYGTETECCDAWGLHCGEKEKLWYPSLVNGEQMCVEGNDYESSLLVSGWLFATEKNCCEAMLLDCSPVAQKWHPKLVNGQKSCVLGVSDLRIQYESEEECCAAFPEACVTSTTSTITAATRPAATAPPCQPSGGKGCHWWPKLDMSEITCIYSSNWPIEAADHLYSDFDSCYCTYHDC